MTDLEAENRRLRTVIARAGITLLPTPDLPDESELDRLLSLVWEKHPVLKSSEASYKAEFAATLHYLAFVFKTEKPDTLHSVNVWIDAAREFLRGQGYNPPPISLKAFSAACVAARVVHEPFAEFPYAVNLGLSRGSAPASAEWRDTLRDGLRPPVEPRNRVAVRAAPTRIDIGMR